MAKMDFGKKAQEIISVVAPTVGTVLGGPLGGLAGAVIASVFGTQDTKAIENAIVSQNPDALLKLREAEAQLTVQMRQLDIDEEKLQVEDRTSARHLAEIQGFGPQILLSILYTLGYFAMLTLFMTGHIAVAAEQEQTWNLLLGVLTTAQVTILTFWFGTSSGSQAKSNLIATVARKEANA